MNVIERIEDLRNRRGWTKYKLAEEAMLTYSTLSAIYSRATPPKIEILEMICNAFGITLAQFFAQNEEAQTVTEDEGELLELYRTLSLEKRLALLTLLKNN
ncbi:MAG: helix-turn-helix domain-containing protein [Clostridia bacterium]|nr:helix-turn-helix domain-containing protein [Clostridia bacterium]MDE6356741.1 helix-turn-helix domain-containing protein [Clostridia bacterium]